MTSTLPPNQRIGLFMQLAAIRGPLLDHLIEVRYATKGAGSLCNQRWFPARDLDAAVGFILGRASTGSVSVGALPRVTEGGGKDAVDLGAVVWADADTDDALARLAAFRPRPNVVVRTGTDRRAHAYWCLSEPTPAEVIESTNRRLALELGTDEQSTDRAKVLRAAGSRNFKHTPATLAECFYARIDAHPPQIREIADRLPELPKREPCIKRAVIDSSSLGPDPLADIPANVYVPALADVEVGRDGKCCCPFHDERTASFHAYDDADKGWYCYGCAAGGRIYDFAAQLWNWPGTRGQAFLDLRQKIAAELLSVRA